MKLEKLALFAEIVSGIAVVVTLLFLVAGIQENTRTTRAAVYGDLIDGVNELESTRLTDPELVALFRAFRRGEISDLDDVDRGRLALYVQILVRNYEKAFYNNRYGVIGASEWERFENAICLTYADARRAGFNVFTSDNTSTSAEFRAYADHACGR